MSLTWLILHCRFLKHFDTLASTFLQALKYLKVRIDSGGECGCHRGRRRHFAYALSVKETKSKVRAVSTDVIKILFGKLSFKLFQFAKSS